MLYLSVKNDGWKLSPGALWPKAWTAFLARHYTVAMSEGSSVSFISEYNKQGIRYRAHPDYQSQGAWYDWVEMSWTMDDDDTGTVEDDTVIFDKEGVKVGRYMAQDRF